MTRPELSVSRSFPNDGKEAEERKMEAGRPEVPRFRISIEGRAEVDKLDMKFERTLSRMSSRFVM
jgi:hypothetical protein